MLSARKLDTRLWRNVALLIFSRQVWQNMQAGESDAFSLTTGRISYLVRPGAAISGTASDAEGF